MTAQRILVVEDDDDIRDTLREVLAAEGYDVAEARDGVDAFAHLKDGVDHVSLILLDMMMPRMDGWTFVDHQTNNPAIAAIPVVVLSAAPRNQLRDIRAVAILQKPLNFDELLAVLRTNC